MKKCLTILTAFLFSAIVFAEQPFFLKNWIIPEDAQWGQKYEIPQIEGITFEQGNEYSGFVYFEIEPYEKSHADLPTYLVKNKLAGWNMTYNQILNAFKASKEFDVYEEVAADYDYNNQEAGLTYSDVIVAVPKQDRSFELTFSFGDLKEKKSKKTAKPEFFCITYDDNSGIYNPELYWNNNNDKEKAILTLTANNASTWGFVISEFDCSVRKPDSSVSDFTGGDAKNLLSNLYGIKSKEELLREVNGSTDWSGREYEEVKALIQKYPDKKPYEIAEIEHKDVTTVAHIYCMKVIGDKLGPHGISFEHKIRSMFLLRLAVGAGIITHDEAVDIAWPIAEELLNWYSSYEDFGFQQILSSTYSGSTSTYSLLSMAGAIDSYYSPLRLLPFDEIIFYGKKSNDEPELSIKDLAYIPQDEEELYWHKLAGISYLYGKLEDIPLIEEAIERYGELEILTALMGEIHPEKYDEKTPAEEFFEENYRTYWNQLPEIEQYAIAFSSNLFELNNMFHLDFSNRISYQYTKNNSKKLLSDSWGITDHKSLVDMFNSLEEYGHSGAYQKLWNLLKKYLDKNPFEIAVLEHLDVLDITRLMYVRDTCEHIGIHGIEAWDEGREITILRWGIACGYISKKEALELMTPVIQRIIKNYTDWNDFIYHYCTGRAFYYLYDYSYSKMKNESINKDLMARAYVPLDEIKFTGENADKDQSFFLADYIEGEDFLKWKEVQLLAEEDDNFEQFDKFIEIEKKYTAYPELFFWRHVLYLRSQSNNDMIDYIEKNLDYLNTYDYNSEEFYYIVYYYILALNYTYQHAKVLNVFASLPSDFSITTYYYYQYAFANYGMLSFCNTQLEYDTYKQRARDAFLFLRDKYNFELDVIIDYWLKSIE